MPRVPESAGPQVQANVSRVTSPTPLSYQRAPSVTGETFGAGLARQQERSGAQLQQAGDQLAQLVMKQQAEDNGRERANLRLQLDEFRRKTTLGDGTPENPGYYNMQGEDAIAGRAKAEEALKKEKQRLAALASNGRVAQDFDTEADVDLSREFDSMARHYGAQRKVAADTTDQAELQSAISDGAAKWNSDADFQATLERGTSVIVREGGLADRNGWSDQVVAAKLREFYTASAKATFDAAISAEDTVRASAILTKNEKRIDGAVAAEMRGKLRSEGLAKAAELISDEARRLYPNDVKMQNKHIRDNSDGKTELAALSRNGMIVGADRATDAERRAIESHAMAKANNQRSRDEAAEREAARKAKADAYRAVNSGRSFVDWQRENPEMFELVAGDGPTVNGIAAAEANYAKRQLFAPATDGKTLGEVRRMDTKDLAEAIPEEYQHRLTPSEFDQFTRLQGAAIKRMEAVREGSSGTYAQGEGLLREFAPQGFKGEWNTAKEKSAVGNARRAAVNEMNAFIAGYTQQGKLPTREEMAKEALRLMLRIKADPTPYVPFSGDDFNGSVANANRLTPEQKAVARTPIKDIPVQYMMDLEADAKATGTKLTDDLREQLAAARGLGDVARYKRLLGR